MLILKEFYLLAHLHFNMQKLLAKYIYKNYYDLLKDSKINLDLFRLGWVKPALIPKQTILYENRLIRKYLTRTLNELYSDFEFQRILCQVGYYGPACTTTTSTTSTTTTSTTTLVQNVVVQNTSAAGTITQFTIGGVTPVGITLPIGPGQSASGHANNAAFTSASTNASGTWGSINLIGSDLTANCNNFTAGPFAYFINVANSPAVTLILSDSPC